MVELEVEGQEEEPHNVQDTEKGQEDSATGSKNTLFKKQEVISFTAHSSPI